MAVCPWCKGQTPKAIDLCPLCGKRSAEHPSISSAGFANFGAFDDFDDAALGVEQDVQPLGDGKPVLVDVFETLGIDRASSSTSFEVDGARQARTAPVRNPGSGSPAVGSAGPRDAAAIIDPYEVAVLADYGSPPDSALLSPGYAVRVMMRRRDLRRQLAAARRAAADASQNLDNLLVAIAERVRPQLDGIAEFAPLLEPLLGAEQTSHGRSSALQERSAEFDKTVAGVDAKFAELQGKIRAAQQVVDAAQTKLRAREEVLKRAVALCKRIEIELRNLQSVAKAAPGGAPATASEEFSARIRTLQQDLDAKRRDTEAPQAEVNGAKAELSEAERALSAVDRQARTLRSERDKLEQAFQREAGVRTAGVQQAETERRTALVAIAQRLVVAPGIYLEPSEGEAFDRAKTLVDKRTLEAVKLAQALGAADPKALRQGWLLIGLALAVVIGLVVAVVVFA